MFGGNWTNLQEIEEDGISKPTPPEATPVKLPSIPVIKPAKVTYNEDDAVVVSHVRSKFAAFNVKRITHRDLRKLNISSLAPVSVDDLLVREYLPSDAWLVDPEDTPTPIGETQIRVFPSFLFNGVRTPEHKQFYSFSQELLADLKDVYHSIRRDPPKVGYSTISIKSFRKFFIALSRVGTYWDDSMDNVVNAVAEAGEQGVLQTPSSNNISSSQSFQPQSSSNVPSSTKVAKLALEDDNPLDTSDVDMDAEDYETVDGLPAVLPIIPNQTTFTYTGRRTSTGAHMPTKVASDMAEAFLEPIMYAFGCHFDQLSRGDHRLFMVDSVMPCSNTKFIYSRPKENAAARRGILEGPIAVLHAYACTNFDTVNDVVQKEDEILPGHFDTEVHVRDTPSGSLEHFFRELKALLLCANERSRFDKLPIEPGNGEWWSRPYEKWGKANDNGAGDKPGEAVGKPLTDIDLFPLGGIPFKTPASLFASAQQNLAAHLKKMTTDENSRSDQESDWDPTGRSDQDGSEASLHSFASEPRLDRELMQAKEENTIAWAGTGLPLKPIDTNTHDFAIHGDSASETESSTTDGTPTTPSRKRSFNTFTGLDSTNDAPPVSFPQFSNVDSQNRDEDGVLDMDAEWESPSRSPSDLNIAASGPVSQSFMEFAGNPPQYAPKSVPKQPDFESVTNNLSKEEIRDEWYRSKLMEERESQDYEKRKRLHGVIKANKRGKTMFPKTRNEFKRIGTHPDASQDEIHLISVVNHHIAFVHMRIHNSMNEWMSPDPREREKVIAMKKDTSTWWGIPLRRSKWYNLFDRNDRVEAMRAAWTIFGRMLDDPDKTNQAGMLASHQKRESNAQSNDKDNKNGANNINNGLIQPVMNTAPRFTVEAAES